MYTDSLYITERFEEQRSKLAQIKSTFIRLAQNIKTNQEISQFETPSILYSGKFCERVLRIIDRFERDLDNLDVADIDIINDDGNHVRQHRNLTMNIATLMKILASFQLLYDQRISGSRSLKIVEYQPSMQSEYGLMGKVYNAVDALSYQLMESCFGEDWVKERQYVPLSLFGHDYSILQLSKIEPSSLITIPYYDCFRARFWPGLAHEVAHSMVAIATTKNLNPYFNSSLHDCMEDEVSILIDTLFIDLSERNDLKNAEDSIGNQIIEIVSDIVATYVCGPASLFSASNMLSFSSRHGYDTFFDAVRYSSHPPIELRVAAMQEVLRLERIDSYYPYFKEITKCMMHVLKGKNITKQDTVSNMDGTYSLQSCTFDQSQLPILIHYFEKEVKLFVREILDILQNSNNNMVQFNRIKWKNITDTIENGSLSELKTPIELMNVAWLVRLKKDMYDRNLSTKQTFDKRKSEMKLFDTLVHFMYRYYEDDVVGKVREYSNI